MNPRNSGPKSDQAPVSRRHRVADDAGDRLLRYESVDEASIRVMVQTFYGCIREHPRLGEIFSRRLEGRWDEHLLKMESFWQSVLLKNGAYKGKPVPAHMKQKELVSSDYGEWLTVFRPVVRELFVPDLADEIIMVAERIAQSLWLATFGFAAATPPPELSVTTSEWGGSSR
ncbi:group III truncated hemoglobin [uncultured Roseibium sp.]|uniref:group III truncated hemoglobin n=1 Tax=uncultured Roseibium sp. TaxID=1936171 RepID=UPI00261F4C68|nr:group III truncated hemoglobin [uncultured Roseibium sp.]